MERKTTDVIVNDFEELKKIIIESSDVDFTKDVFYEQSKGISEILDRIGETIGSFDINKAQSIERKSSKTEVLLPFCKKISK